MEKLNYNTDVPIDATALDVEWLAQSELMLRYARHAARMQNIADLSKQKLQVVMAELDKDIRANPKSYGLDKITETVIERTILLQPEHQAQMQVYLEDKYESDMAQHAVRVIAMRKTALEELVELFRLQYFAGPSSPRNITKEWERKRKSEEAANHTKMTRRKKE